MTCSTTTFWTSGVMRCSKGKYRVCFLGKGNASAPTGSDSESCSLEWVKSVVILNGVCVWLAVGSAGAA